MLTISKKTTYFQMKINEIRKYLKSLALNSIKVRICKVIKWKHRRITLKECVNREKKLPKRKKFWEKLKTIFAWKVEFLKSKKKACLQMKINEIRNYLNISR